MIGIEGVVGIGKSALANEVFLIAEEEFENTFWADATRRYSFNDWSHDVLEAFAYPLPKKRESDEDEIDELKLIITLIQCLQRKKCLLVIDNLETLLNENRGWHDSSYLKFFAKWRDCRGGSVVLLTTQIKPNDSSKIKWLNLKGLEESEGAALLQQEGIQGTEEKFLRPRGYNSRLRDLYEVLLKEWNPDEQHINEFADINYKLGKSYHAIGNFTKAEEFYKNAINLFENQITQNEPDQALFSQGLGKALQGLGKTYIKLKYYPQALSCYQKSKDIFGNRKKEKAYSIEQLGKIYHDQKNYSQAIASYREALDILENITILDQDQNSEAHYKNRRGKAHCFDKLALTYFDMEEYAEAINYHEQALNIYEETSINDLHSKAYSLNNLGRCYYKLDKFNQAEEYYKKALTIFRDPQIQDRRGEAYSLHNLGNFYQTLKEYDKAMTYHNESLKIYEDEEINDKSGMAECYEGLGIVYRYLGDYQNAIKCHGEALSNFQDKLNIAKSSNSLAEAYKADNQVDLAIYNYEQSQNYYREIGDTRNENILSNRLLNYIVNDLAKYREKSEYYACAIKYYNQATEKLLKRNSDDFEYRIAVFDGLGNCNEALSDHQKAIDYYKKARRIKCYLNDDSKQKLDMLAFSADKIGNNYRELGNKYIETNGYGAAIKYYRAAIKYYKVSLKIQEQIGEAYSPGLGGKAYTFVYLAEAYEKLDNILEAIHYLEEAVKVFQEMNNDIGKKGENIYTRNLFNLLNKLGGDCRSLKQYEQAIEYYQKSLEVQQPLGYTSDLAYTFTYLAETYQDLDNLTKAINNLEEAVKVFQEINYQQNEGHYLLKVASLLRQTGKNKQSFVKGRQAMLVFLKTWNLPPKISNLLRPIQNRQLHPLLYFLLGVILVLIWWCLPNVFLF